MELIDTHCHLDVSEFDADRDAVLQHCITQGVTRIVIPAIHAASWQGLLNLCAQHPGLHPALGLHPVYLDSHQAQDLDALEDLIGRQRPVAIGEIGLDYFLKELNRARQQQLFEAQLNIARAAHLPVVVHVRKAHDVVLQTLRRIPVEGGIIHAFNGSLQQAQHYIDLGFRLGFGGTLTYPGAHKIHALAKTLPLSALVLETDAPDITVASHRGERNSPEYLPECLAALAQVRDEAPEVLAQQTTRNAIEVLHLAA